MKEGYQYSSKPSMFRRELVPGTIVLMTVAFSLMLANLLPPVTQAADTSLASTNIIRASMTHDNLEANGSSERSDISADGTLIAFASLASNLVPDDQNNTWDVFVRDRTLSTTIRVSLPSSGAETDHQSKAPVISDDGRWVAYESDASNIAGGTRFCNAPGAFCTDVFVYDLWNEEPYLNTFANSRLNRHVNAT